MAPGINLKLLVDTKNQKVVFADAGEDFVDFLFNISYLPVGTMMKLFADHGDMGGCLTNIYQSIEKFGQTIMLPSLNKDDILMPKCVTLTASKLKALPDIQTSTSSTFNVCFESGCRSEKTCNVSNTLCPNAHTMKKRYVEEPYPKGFLREVKGYVRCGTYMVMDDLTVRPASGLSSIEIVKESDVKNVGFLEAREVHLGVDNALKLFKASMQSKTVLTDVFLRGEDLKDSK